MSDYFYSLGMILQDEERVSLDTLWLSLVLAAVDNQ